MPAQRSMPGSQLGMIGAPELCVLSLHAGRQIGPTWLPSLLLR
jgi:hypothetical protein